MTGLSDPGRFGAATHPSEMPLATHLETHLEKSKRRMDTARIEDLLALAFQVAAIMGGQGKITSRQALVKAMERIKEQTAINASTYNSRTVIVLTFLGAAVSVGSSAYAAWGMTSVISSNAGLDSQGVYNLLQPWSAKQQIGSGIGQLITAASQIAGQHDTAKRTIGEGVLGRWTFKRDMLQQAVGSNSHKADEAMQSVRDHFEKLHRAATAA